MEKSPLVNNLKCSVHIILQGAHILIYFVRNLRPVCSTKQNLINYHFNLSVSVVHQ